MGLPSSYANGEEDEQRSMILECFSFSLQVQFLATTDARGHTTRNFYDKAYRLIHTLSNPVDGDPSSDPQNPGTHDILTASTFDPNSNPLEVIDPNGNVTRNHYDRLNRLIATATNPNDGQPNAPPATPKADDIVVTNEYDDSNNLVKVTDGESQVTAYRYDGLARKTRTIWDPNTPVERIETATFDGVVQLTRLDPNGQETEYQYDALNRLSKLIYELDTLGDTHIDNRQYAYDLVNNLLGVSYPNETIQRQVLRGCTQVYDHLDRVISETSAGATHTHSYDKANNRRTTIYADTGRTLVSTYDKLNRLVSLTENTTQVTTYAYDLNSNITRKTHPNGTATHCTFDALNRKLSNTSLTATGTIISAFDYSQPQGTNPSGYDDVGNVLKIVEQYGHTSVNDRTITNVYDHTYRLEQETRSTGVPPVTPTTTVTQYTYDKANNRTQKRVTIDSGTPTDTTYTQGTHAEGYNSNQIKSVTEGGTTTTFEYDPNGNRTEKKINGTTAQTYFYDHENRLTSITDTTLGTYAYSYDHRTRRVGRDESAASGVNEDISFAGGLSVQEYLNGATQPTMEYIRGSDYGGGIGGVLYTIRSGARSYNTYNSRGDVISQTDDTQAITYQAAYEAFGTRTQEEGSTLDRQKANTKDEDPTGLLNEGMRYRDLEFGIFLTRDPLGHVDGPNEYTYVRQNPWTYYDPYGLDGFKTFRNKLWDNTKNVVSFAEDASGKFFNTVSGGRIHREYADSFDQKLTGIAEQVGSDVSAANKLAHSVVGGNANAKSVEEFAQEIIGGENIEEGAANLVFASVPFLKYLRKGGIPRSSRTTKADTDKQVEAEGVVYLRTDQNGSEYVGKAKNEKRYEKRQKEHADANPDLEFEFEELERVPSGSRRSLDVAEEDWIRAGGGPKNKSNPNGRLQNRRHEMSEKRYREAEGKIDQ